MRIRYLLRTIPGILLPIGIIMSIPSADARKIRTKHSIPKTAKGTLSSDVGQIESKNVSIASDSIDFFGRINPAIRFYGFDKTVASNIESFFISNSLVETIIGMELDITYIDMKGRQLHKRSVSIDCDIPGGETKRYDIKSWDTQKSFYFHQSVKPKRQATPFNVKIELLSVTLISG